MSNCLFLTAAEKLIVVRLMKIPPASYETLRFITVLRTVHHFSLSQNKVKVKITLSLAAYRQSIRLGVKPLETHDQIFFKLSPCSNRLPISGTKSILILRHDGCKPE
jgi:hypothetical protein